LQSTLYARPGDWARYMEARMPLTRCLRRRSGIRKTIALVFVASFATAQAARGDDAKEVCASASERAQQLRDDGKLRAAREQLVACAQRRCPSVIQGFCERLLSEVESDLPSVVVTARDAQGRDLEDVRVTVDGTPLVEHLGGTALWVDPGAHTF